MPGLLTILVASSLMFQSQPSPIEKDFNLVFQEASYGHLMEAENLLNAAIEKYSVPGQPLSDELIAAIFWRGSALFVGLQRGHKYQDMERILNHVLSLMRVAEAGQRAALQSLYLGMLADSYRAEADYQNAEKVYERWGSLGPIIGCGHYQDVIGATEVYLARKELAEAGKWLQPALERARATCGDFPLETRLFSSLTVIYRETGQVERARELEKHFPAQGSRIAATVEQGILLARIRAAQKDFSGSDLAYQSTLAETSSFWSSIVLEDYAQTLRNYGRTKEANAVEKQLAELREAMKRASPKH